MTVGCVFQLSSLISCIHLFLSGSFVICLFIAIVLSFVGGLYLSFISRPCMIPFPSVQYYLYKLKSRIKEYF